MNTVSKQFIFFTFAKNENHVRKTYGTKFEKFLVEKLKIRFWGVTSEVVTANRLKRGNIKKID